MTRTGKPKKKPAPAAAKPAPKFVPKLINFPPAVLAEAVQRHDLEKSSLVTLNADHFSGLVVKLVELYGKGVISLNQ